MNFITRKDFRGGDLTVSYEQPQEKGGKVMSVQGGAGFGDLTRDRFNLLGTFSHQKFGG